MSLGSQRDGSDPRSLAAALTLGLSGRYWRQGSDAAEAVRLWAETTGVRLSLVDDESSAKVAVRAYESWVRDADILLGPYSSGLVRAVAPAVEGTGRLLWNHGGSADDLARPGVVCVPAPASTYMCGVIDVAAARGIKELVIVQGPGPFSDAVAAGARAYAERLGLAVRMATTDQLAGEDLPEIGLLIAGSFEHDVEVVRHLDQRPRLVAAVAAGIPAFGQELGEASNDVLGPVHWWPTARKPEVGPSGLDFVAEYKRRTGREPSYVAALATVAGHLALDAERAGITIDNVRQWTTSTMLGDFALDADWRQVGYRVATVRWRDGRMIPPVRVMRPR